jgi:hypothetical protein
MAREPGQQCPEVASRLASSPLCGRGDCDNKVSGLKTDRVVTRSEKEPFDDPVEPRVRSAVMGEVGEEPAEPCVVLAEAAVDDDNPEVVLGGKADAGTLRANMNPVA